MSNHPPVAVDGGAAAVVEAEAEGAAWRELRPAGLRRPRSCRCGRGHLAAGGQSCGLTAGLGRTTSGWSGRAGDR